MVKTILFDLDDTLLDFHKAEAIAIEKTLEQAGIEPLPAIVSRYSEINARQWELLEEGKLTRAQVLVRRFEILFEELGVNSSSQEAQDTFLRLLSKGHYFIPGAVELLEELFPRYDLYIVSNGTAKVQDSRLASAGIGKYFKKIFISQRIGYNKPSPEFFNHCFAEIPNFKREESIMIGDSLTSDMRGGNLSGIPTCWFNPHRKPGRDDIPVDFEVTALDQIPALLEKLNTCK